MEISLQNRFLQLIDAAIKSQLVVQLRHKGAWRTVEPYMAGIYQNKQSASLYCYCRDVIPGQQSGNTRWQIFNLDDIDDMELTLYGFETHIEYQGSVESFGPVYVKMAA